MIDCTSQRLLVWVKEKQVESSGVTTSERERLKALEREVKELLRANKILKLASTFLAPAEFDRPQLEALKAFANLQGDHWSS